MAATRRLSELGGRIAKSAQDRLPERGPFLVALSGGADSAVCVWIALQTGRPVRAVHVDHGFTASPLLRAAAAAIAAALGIDLSVVEIDIEEGASSEAIARDARYAALEEAAADAVWLLTGHTADDQAETVLGNLLRGAGAAGLTGIPVSRGRWVRPLLDTTRTETRELAGLLALPFVDDPANIDPALRRNVLRREVIPDLESRFNPALRPTLTRTAAVLAADDELLERRAGRVPIRSSAGAWVTPGPLLSTLPAPVAARVVRRLLRLARPPYPGREDEVAAVLEVAGGAVTGAELAGGWRVEREGPLLTVFRPGTATGFPARPLAVPGLTRVAHLTLDARVEATPPVPWPLRPRHCVLDADAVAGAEVCPATPDDRIDLPDGSKPAAAALAEAGVPARLRSGWPVVAVRGRLAWVVAGRSAPWAWPGEATTRYLILTATNDDESP